MPVAFHYPSGRRLDDGSIRIKTDVTPAELPFAIAADGVVRSGPEGLGYSGTYPLTEVAATAEDGRPAAAPGWRSEGTFALTRDRLVIDKAVLSEGPPDRPSSLAGSLAIDLGTDARFVAHAEARQLDLDRSLGEGPAKPVDVGTAARSLVARLADLPVPPIPGRLTFNVPGIVVGGAVIQDVRFDAVFADGGWQIEGFGARLPGQATISADGRLATGATVGFGGQVRLAVGQPATFASWWRGRSELGAGRLLAPFDLSGRATISPAGIQVEDMGPRIGDAPTRGGLAWTAARENSPLRLFRTALSADRLDFRQIQALAELLAGQDLGDTTALADSYSIRFVADELAIGDIAMRNVQVDAGFEDGDLTVNGIDINDIGGATIRVTRGRIDNVLTDPRGRLEAQLGATSLTGLARIVDQLLPATAISRWFARAAPSLSPASLSVVVNSGAAGAAASATTVQLIGDAAETKVEATVDVAGVPASWRTGDVRLSASIKSHDAMGMARQTGLPVATVPITGGAQVGVTATGVPATGMTTAIDGNFAGLVLDGDGSLILAADLPPKFAGTLSVDSPDVDPLLRMAGLTIPGTEAGVPAKLAGSFSMLGLATDLEWANGEVAGHRVGGRLRLGEGPGGTLRFDGALGFAPLPGDDPSAPWPTTPFAEPVLDGLGGKLDLKAETLTIGDRLAVANPVLTFGLAPNRIDFDVKSGTFIGGSVVGGLSIRNVGGSASLAGRFSLVGGALDSLVWQRAGRSVAVGTVDLSADFESTGRSPAGLVSSLTGGGTLAIHDGEVRYVNPRAVSLVIRSADLGQEYTEDALRDLLGSYIDAGALAFTEVEGPFSIAAGTVRFQNMALATAEARAGGSAAIDLNTLSLDADWSLTLDTGDPKDEATPPQVGLVFRGPLADPVRTIDVLQFASYLNIRQEQRIQEILALEEAARLENDRFKRERRRIKEEADRKAAELAALHDAQAAAAVRLEAFHNAREIAAEEKAVAELAAAQQRAAEVAAAKAAAGSAAVEARARADQARAAAVAASADAAARTADYDRAAADVAALTAAREAADAALAAAERALAEANAAAEAASAAAAIGNETDSQAAMTTASAEREAA
ncbi:MAG TPA: AsmA-like C-terminal region-containing protein, partial [Bauldia sp.]|nr:AsmA-like C-terminal region-containing protein [Bauldia sp.]